MKIGCCTNMVAVNPDRTGIEHIEKLKLYGYDYIELPLAQIMELPDAEFCAFRDRISSSRLKCEVCNNFFPAKVRLTGEEADKDKTSRYLEGALGRAVKLGVKVIVLGSSGAKNVPEGFPLEKAWEQLVELLCHVDGFVKDLGITIAIEPLNRLESNIITTASEGLKLVKEVNRENIRLLIDYYHLVMEKEAADILFDAQDNIRHIHFSSPQERTFPKAADSDDYGVFFKKLKKIGYEGRVSIEAYSKDFESDAPHSLELLRKL